MARTSTRYPLDHGKLIIKDIPENIPDDSTINSAHVRWSNVADSSRPGYYILNGTFTVSRGGSTQNFKFTKGAYYGAVEFGGALTDVKFAKLDLGEADPWISVKEALSRFSPKLDRARQVYLAFLAEGENHGGKFESIWEEIRSIAKEEGGDSRFGDGRVVGEPEFVRKSLALLEREAHELRKLRENRPDLQAIFDQCLKKHKIADPADLLRGRKDGRLEAREEFCHLAYRRYGYSLGEIGTYLGMQPSSVYHRVVSRQRG